MRFSSRTKSGLVVSVALCTKPTMAAFAGPSFHEGNWSATVIAMLSTPHALGFELPRLELLASGAVVPELVDGRTRWREGERSERLGKHLVEGVLLGNADCDVKVEMLPARHRNK